jgi:isocitrate dehydrogenase
LAEQTKDASLAAKFKLVANELTNNEDKIVDELNAVQGVSMDVCGYYKPDFAKASAAMRPSETLNQIISKV